MILTNDSHLTITRELLFKLNSHDCFGALCSGNFMYLPCLELGQYQPVSSSFPQEAVEELLCGNVRKLSLLFLKEGCSFKILCFCIPKIHGSLLDNSMCVGIRTLSLLFFRGRHDL